MTSFKQMRLYFGLLLVLLLVMLTACQAKSENEETIQQEQDGIQWVANFSADQFVRKEDPFQSMLASLLNYYGKGETSATLADMRGYPGTGQSYLDISRKIADETDLYTTFINLTFDEAKAEIAKDRPLISYRTVRGYLEDYVFLAGYDADADALMGYSIVSNDPIKVTKQNWDEEYQFLQMNLSIIAAGDEDNIRKREESSPLYWLQIGAEAVLDMDDVKLEQAIIKIRELGVTVRRVDYLNAYYEVFVQKELTPEVEEFLDKVYEAGPSISHAIEWKFLREWTLGDRENAINYMREIERDQKFAATYLSSLYIFEEIYTELGEDEMLQSVREIISIKEENPEYMGIPGS